MSSEGENGYGSEDRIEEDVLILGNGRKVFPAPVSRGRKLVKWTFILLILALLGLSLYIICMLTLDRSATFAKDMNRCDEYLGTTLLGIQRRTGRALCAEHSMEYSGGTDLGDSDVNSSFPRSRPQTILNVSQGSFQFAVLGDWGRDGFCCQRDVAYELEKALKNIRAEWLINTGDNFYDDGIQSRDDIQVQTSWRDVYTDPERFPYLAKTPWYSILGNHDWYGNYKAVISMSKLYDTWVLPDRWYSEEVALQGGKKALFVFLDTSVIYYSVNETIMEEMLMDTEDMEFQLQWLQNTLEGSAADWKFVVGHHPVTTSGSHADEENLEIERFRNRMHPIFQKYGVAPFSKSMASLLTSAAMTMIYKLSRLTMCTTLSPELEVKSGPCLTCLARVRYLAWESLDS